MSPIGTTPNGNHMYLYMQNGQENVVNYDSLSNFSLLKSSGDIMRVRCLAHASLGRISFNVGPLLTSLISTLLSVVGPRHNCTLQVAFGTRTHLIYYSNVSFKPKGTIICCFCCWFSFSLRSSWSNMQCSPSGCLVWSAVLLYL